eukprot:3914145-Prymnesium_polylepis.1
MVAKIGHAPMGERIDVNEHNAATVVKMFVRVARERHSQRHSGADEHRARMSGPLVPKSVYPVSYTHLTLPTICSV